MVEQSSAKSDAEHPSPMNSDEEDEVFKDCFETKVVQSMEDSLESKALAASLFKANDVVGALNKYSLALHQAPESETKHRAILNFNMGMCLKQSAPAPPADKPPSDTKAFGSNLFKEMNAEHKQCVEHFTKAIELDPDYLKPVYQRMWVYKLYEDYEAALKDAQRVLELDPQFPKMKAEVALLERLH